MNQWSIRDFLFIDVSWVPTLGKGQNLPQLVGAWGIRSDTVWYNSSVMLTRQTETWRGAK